MVDYSRGATGTSGSRVRGAVPIRHQLVPMQVEPLQHVNQCATRKPPRNHVVADPDGDLVVPVGSVEVRRIMVTVQDRDGDPEEAADDRHDRKIPRRRVAAYRPS